MDEIVQQKIAQACIALLQKDAANDGQERACGIQSQEEVRPSTKDENLDYVRSVQASNRALQRQQLAAKKQMWETVAKRPDLTSEQRAEVVRALEDYSWLLK